MNKFRFKKARKFAINMCDNYIGNIISFGLDQYVITGFIFHQADGKTAIIENVITGDEDFIPYHHILSLHNTHAVKSYERLPQLS